ncbi:hypothetical protein GCM10010423_76950 [Streptomyces levis]|uniref:Uncharacterized protein n=1 Tax=Streptomyces levis TaxID=285566 RepID=A0ABP6BFA3_9ACTN
MSDVVRDVVVPVHGESFPSGRPSEHVRRALDDHGGSWPMFSQPRELARVLRAAAEGP